MKFAVDVRAPQGVSPDVFGDPLTFPPVPQAGISYSSVQDEPFPQV